MSALAADEDGYIYVVDSQVPALRKYGPDGRYVATFGREGGGPGEYKGPDGGLAVLPDGRIALRDPGNARITLYTPEGEPAGTWPIRGGFTTSRPMVVDTAGNVYTLILLDPGADVTKWRMGVVRYGPDGSPRDTLPAPVWAYEPPTLVALERSADPGHEAAVPGDPRGAGRADLGGPVAAGRRGPGR